MRCNNLFKEALNNLYKVSGIKFNYKLDSTLSSMEPKMKMSATQLEGYLKKKGVSPKEIEQSGLLHSTDTKSQPISYWLNKIKDGNQTMHPTLHILVTIYKILIKMKNQYKHY